MSQPPQTHADRMKSKGGLSRVWKACGYTLEGFKAAYRHEHAFRQEVWVIVPLILFATFWSDFNALARAMLIGSLLLILIVELLNSSVEANTDHISPDQHPLAKRAKDMGSAAVFLAIVNAAIIWGGVLLNLYGSALWSWLF